MAEKRNVYKIQDIGGVGEVHISDEVIAMIAALAATDAEGVSLNGTNTKELRQKSSTKNLSKGVKIIKEEGTVAVDLNLNLAYGQSILDTGKTVQERVKSSIENMTGLTVTDVNIHVGSVNMDTAGAQ